MKSFQEFITESELTKVVGVKGKVPKDIMAYFDALYTADKTGKPLNPGDIARLKMTAKDFADAGYTVKKTSKEFSLNKK